MKKLLIAGAALAALIGTPALAADMALKAPPPPAPVCVWCGWYVGVNIGGGWGNNNTGNFVTATPDFGPAIALGLVPGNLGLKPSGVLGGGQVGYNWQTGIWVFGLEADFQGSDVKDSRTINLGIPPVSLTTLSSDKLSWFGTVRGRLGITPAANFLLYGTGGFAYGETKDSGQWFNPAVPVTGGNFFSSQSNTRGGWTAGGGAEWMFMPKWSFKVEYLYADLGNTNLTLRDTTGNFPASTLTYQYKHRYNIARAGVNWHF
jgi:outer membrane immunogenic protein